MIDDWKDDVARFGDALDASRAMLDAKYNLPYQTADIIAVATALYAGRREILFDEVERLADADGTSANISTVRSARCRRHGPVRKTTKSGAPFAPLAMETDEWAPRPSAVGFRLPLIAPCSEGNATPSAESA